VIISIIDLLKFSARSKTSNRDVADDVRRRIHFEIAALFVRLVTPAAIS
jgi:hypothetical protein